MAKKLAKTASTESHLQQGEKQVIRLQLDEKAAPLAAPLATATATLRAAWEKRLAAERALVPFEVKSAHADHAWDMAVRGTAKTLEVQAGGTKTPAYREVFPKGFGVLVTPSGDAQLLAAGQFISHFSACTSPEAKKVAEEYLPKLQTARDGLRTELAARKQAEGALFAARAEELAAKRDYSRTIDKTIAEIRALYPEDRRRQDLLFPSIGRSTEDNDDEQAPVSEPG
ncbi:MAG: hypothetical protein ACOX6T_07220 [Myxococcales bacterium]|jgi:hypothetical protein